MRIEVDLALCHGHAQCEEVAPEIFEVRDDGYAALLITETSEPRLCALAQEAALRCPAEAILLRDS